MFHNLNHMFNIVTMMTKPALPAMVHIATMPLLLQYKHWCSGDMMNVSTLLWPVVWCKQTLHN